MQPVDTEDVQKAIQRCLKSDQFNECLQEVYLEKQQRYGDELECLFPTEVFEQQRWNPDQQFPYGELNAGIARNLAGTSGGARHLMHEIQIYWHERADSEADADLRVKRLLRATRDYFEKYEYIEGLESPPVNLNDDVFSPFVPANIYDGRPFLKSGLLIVYVETYGGPNS